MIRLKCEDGFRVKEWVCRFPAFHPGKCAKDPILVPCTYQQDYPDSFQSVLEADAQANGFGGFQCPQCKNRLKTFKVTKRAKIPKAA